MTDRSPQLAPTDMPPILADRSAAGFWLASLCTGLATGLATAALTGLLALVQHAAWPGAGLDLLQAASQTSAWHRGLMLLGAGVLTGVAQMLLTRLASGNGIDINTAIWFFAGRLPALRTAATAVLSIVIVGLGTALGREGAPKQAGAVIANLSADRFALSDEQRRLLVACGAGAGMAAAYGVPLGGALFALEVLRGALALRLVLPALLTTLAATELSWAFLPDAPLYDLPVLPNSPSSVAWAVVAGPLFGLAAVGYVRLVAWADSHKPRGWGRLVTPVVVLGGLGLAAIPFPQLLGNGKDVAELAFRGPLAPGLLLAVAILRPAATILCLRSGAPGGLFTPSLATGALLGGLLGLPWGWLWPGQSPGLFAYLGAAAMLAATTQGPISTLVLMMELSGHARSAIIPLLLIVALATLVARTIDPRSVYDARLNESQMRERQHMRDHLPRLSATKDPSP